MCNFIKKRKMTILSLSTILYYLLIYIIDINIKIKEISFIVAIIIGIIVIATNVFILNEYEKKKKIDFKKIICVIGVIGILLRTAYILYTPITERQHDLEKDVGHLAYIETIYKTGKLPTHNKWQFYQQPLHHIIAAGWLKINEIFGIDLATSEEGIQIITAIYSSMIILISYCILKELNIDNKLKLLVMTVISVHPTLIILAGSINNDILMIMLTFLAILYLIKWYKKSSMPNTIILAIITALIALTKISGTIIAIPILYIFINKFLQDYFKGKAPKIIKDYIWKFIIFGVISLGLGLSYSIRNMYLFNQSIFYVPTAGSAVYCGNRSLIDRLEIFSPEWLKVFAYPIGDCNIWAYLVKSSLFGEYHLENINLIPSIMLVLNIVIILISLICLIKVIAQSKKTVEIKMIILFYLVQICMFIYSNIAMPYGCTMDFRYIVPTIMFGMIFIVYGIKDTKYERNVSRLIYVFAIMSVIFELTYMQYLNI